MIKHFSVLTLTLPFFSIFTLLMADLFLLSGAYPMPFLGLIAMIYWSIYRPDLTHIYLLLMLGLLVDVIQGHDIWVHMLIFLIINLIAVSQFKFFYRKPFYLIWAGVSAIVLIYYVMLTFHLVFFLKSDVQAITTLSRLILTIAFVPVIFKMMIYLHGLLHERV